MSVHFTAARSFWANPVVTRDLRVRMRGSRAYWNQGAYLLLLGLLAIAGYDTASNNNIYANGVAFDPVLIQGRLHDFYNFIFMALAALVTLIAPALTAATITTERQNLTLDMLVTTPLSAAELLYGKLLSSVAFIILLLVLSLPASALCVMLGGATLGDVFRIYFIICVDGLLIAAIGLYFSCAVRQSLAAILWTYLAVGAFYVECLIGLSGVYSGPFARGGAAAPFTCFAMLDPFAAVQAGQNSFQLMGASIPMYIGVAFVAFLIIRLLVTAAAYRLASYGGGLAGSLRRQVLFFTFITGMAFFHSVIALTPAHYRADTMLFPVAAAFGCSALFLPSLFTPAAPEDAEPGACVEGWYRPKRAFRSEHAGALPFFHIWLLTLLGSTMAGIAARQGSLRDCGSLHFWALTVFWLSSLGFLVWALSRWAAGIVKSLSSARALAFGTALVIAIVPFAIMLITNADGSNLDTNPLGMIWILSPLLHAKAVDSGAFLFLAGSISYGAGIIFSRFWRAVVPGGRKGKVVHAAKQS
jgi:ABC-type transport system involved in multi-copper enzyme maturation permease subunit